MKMCLKLQKNYTNICSLTPVVVIMDSWSSIVHHIMQQAGSMDSEDRLLMIKASHI